MDFRRLRLRLGATNPSGGLRSGRSGLEMFFSDQLDNLFKPEYRFAVSLARQVGCWQPRFEKMNGFQ